MAWSPVLGVLLVVAGLSDLFFTALHHEGFGFLSSRMYRVVWRATRVISEPLPDRPRQFLRTLAAPAMIPLTIGLWLGTQLVGFALIILPGLHHGGFEVAADQHPSFGLALYVSATTLSTLGFGDVTPRGGPYELLSGFEAVVGLAIITLAITYVLNVFQVIARLGTLAARLRHQAQDGREPRTILVVHFPHGEPVAIGELLRELHTGVVDLYEGMRRYPLVHYVTSRHAYRSSSFVFLCVGEIGATLRWCLPDGHPVTRDPWLPPLLAGFDHVRDGVTRHFLPGPQPEPPGPVGTAEFRAALRDPDATEDRWLRSFLDSQRFLADLARVEPYQDEEEAELRYHAWLAFMGPAVTFVEALAADLGQGDRKLTRETDVALADAVQRASST